MPKDKPYTKKAERVKAKEAPLGSGMAERTGIQLELMKRRRDEIIDAMSRGRSAKKKKKAHEKRVKDMLERD